MSDYLDSVPTNDLIEEIVKRSDAVVIACRHTDMPLGRDKIRYVCKGIFGRCSALIHYLHFKLLDQYSVPGDSDEGMADGEEIV